MNSKGEVRSASEFKEIFEETGDSHGPYRCPFCEVLYEDRCIVTECVRAPHFKLPNGKGHRGDCNGESGDDLATDSATPSTEPKRTVVGDIELPEALVKRRKSLNVRKPGDDGHGLPPDTAEITRRRRLVVGDKTLSTHYTTSLLRPLVQARKRLRKHAYERAIGAKLKQGTPEYNLHFGNTLAEHKLSLYGQKLTYGNAFQDRNLVPGWAERIYNGSGKVRIEGDQFVIADVDVWPKVPKNKDKENFVPFEVRLGRAPERDAPTSHKNALRELEDHAAAGAFLEWHAYGLPVLQENKFVLSLDSLDHIYWPEQHQR